LLQRAALHCAGLRGGRIAVIPPALDLEPAPLPAHARMPAGLEGAPLIVYAGRLRHEDRLDLLLAVLPGLRRRFPGVHLLVAGGGPREAELAERLRELGRAAVGFVASKRSWEATAARYRRLYDAVLAQHRRRH
jgi:glycosyltransferase involved in cell wall biosynthesis